MLYQLNYGRSGRADRIRTCDPLLPKQMRYQAALRPDRLPSGTAERRRSKGQYSALPATRYSPSAVIGPQSSRSARHRGG